MIPETILFSSIDLGDRARTTYHAVDDLAESILEHGLIQPVVVEPTNHAAEPKYLLRAGGRRYHALLRLNTQCLWHATSSDPARPGFLLANVAADELRGLLIEIAENHNREDIDWRDDMTAIVKAYRLWEREKHARGERALMFQFGQLLGIPYPDVKQGIQLYDEITKNPERYVDCISIYGAYQTFLKVNAEAVAKLAAQKSFARVPAFHATDTSVPLAEVPEPTYDLAPVVIPISHSLFLGNGLDFMSALPPEAFDHIITDPDYAVAVDRLESNTDTTDGVVHDSIESSLRDLERFIVEAYRVTKSFCILWYDLDHHEKLHSIAGSVGWAVQRWPLIWHKVDHRSNGAPQHNFCKNIEYALVLRKPGAVLAQVQTSCVYSCPAGDAVRTFGHPFAKPTELWRWIYSAVTIRGQSVLDPFAGKGSAPCAALRAGLRPCACEIQEVHFNDLTLNLQAAYREVLGPNIRFS